MGRVSTKQLKKSKLAALIRKEQLNDSRLSQPASKRLQSSGLEWQWTTSYMMTAFAFAIGFITMLLHSLDLLIAWPFHGASIPYDIVVAICGATLAGMSFATYRNLCKRTG